MKIIVVDTPSLEMAFIRVNPDLLSQLPNYIRPLDKDIEQVFDAKTNKAFRNGAAMRWLLQADDGRYIGRIAAFDHAKYKNKGDRQPTGGFGFFDCINDQQAAGMLLSTAQNWLSGRGKQAMDGPINFGERDRWWGLLMEGDYPPLYCMNYNPPYYRLLLENYGCQVFYLQFCWRRSVQGRLDEKFYSRHEEIVRLGGYEARRVRKKELEKYATDFMQVYNQAWASHEGNKEMTKDQAIKLFKTLAPVMDEDIAWLAYYHDEPIAMYINIPDLNQIFRHFNGRFGLWEKLQFLYYRWRGECSTMVGIIFGIVPAFQGKGIDRFLVVEAAKIIQPMGRYQDSELQWQGDFNPKMLNISRELGFAESRKLAVFRYLFDRSQPFERHPVL